MADSPCPSITSNTTDTLRAHGVVEGYAKLMQPERWQYSNEETKSKGISNISYALVQESIDKGVPVCHIVQHIKKLPADVRDEVINYFALNTRDLLHRNDPVGAKLLLNVLWEVRAESDSAAFNKNLAQLIYFKHPAASNPTLSVEKANFAAEYAERLSRDPDAMELAKLNQEETIRRRIGRAIDVGHTLLENPDIANQLRKESLDLFNKVNQEIIEKPIPKNATGTVLAIRTGLGRDESESSDPALEFAKDFQRGFIEYKFAKTLKQENIQSIITMEFSTELSFSKNDASEACRFIRKIFPILLSFGIPPFDQTTN